jgi:hypothetical protein
MTHSIVSLTATGVLVALAAVPASAATVKTLYNGGLGTAPNAQGWFNYGSGTPTVSGGGTSLDSGTNDANYAGYVRFGNVLNATTGYTLRFDLQVLSENHSNPSAQKNPSVDTLADRAGVSLTVLSSNPKKSIELGFWSDRIWAQNGGTVKAAPNNTGTRFTQGEGVAFNTATSIRRYDLSVKDNSYFLYANGNYQSALLSGLLRDYTLEGSPYTTSNFLFLGDNTTSARGKFKINLVTLTDAAISPPQSLAAKSAVAIPTPALLPSLLLLGWRTLRKAKR